MGKTSALTERAAEAAVPGQPSIGSRDDAITALYTQIRELVARSGGEPGLSSEIDHKIKELRVLQEAEADELERRFEVQLQLPSGTGWQHLQRMRERLGDA